MLREMYLSGTKTFDQMFLRLDPTCLLLTGSGKFLSSRARVAIHTNGNVRCQIAPRSMRSGVYSILILAAPTLATTNIGEQAAKTAATSNRCNNLRTFRWRVWGLVGLVPRSGQNQVKFNQALSWQMNLQNKFWKRLIERANYHAIVLKYIGDSWSISQLGVFIWLDLAIVLHNGTLGYFSLRRRSTTLPHFSCRFCYQAGACMWLLSLLPRLLQFINIPKISWPVAEIGLISKR